MEILYPTEALSIKAPDEDKAGRAFNTQEGSRFKLVPFQTSVVLNWCCLNRCREKARSLEHIAEIHLAAYRSNSEIHRNQFRFQTLPS